MKILVFGGTRFFGQGAVAKLIDRGHQVTIATRGNTANPFEGRANHFLIDVQDFNHPGWDHVSSQKWDAVFNNILYTKEDAEQMIEVFKDLTAHFYFTSSMAVYSGEKDGYLEEDFNPHEYQIDPSIEVTYGEGKRQAEAVLANQDYFQVTGFRFPIVLDDNDYTKRLHHYVEKAVKDDVIEIYNPQAKVNYVKGTMASDAIVWAIENQIPGFLNVSSSKAVPFSQMIDWLEEAVGHPLKVTVKDDIEYAPLSTRQDQYVVADKVAELGFEIDTLDAWMPALMQRIAETLDK